MEWRCPECRTRRKSHKLFTQHLRDTGHAYCHCGGYHYTHRKGSTYCYENPISDMYHAARQGADDETLLRIAAHINSTHPDLAAKVTAVCKLFNLRKSA